LGLVTGNAVQAIRPPGTEAQLHVPNPEQVAALVDAAAEQAADAITGAFARIGD
jgi:hypothetical protein